MCNYCECENMDKCSIVGNIPLGFCCPKCKFYTGAHTCLNSRIRTQDKIKAITKKIEALREAFSKNGNSSEEEEEEAQELEKYP
ncbi:MAG: hypothetical protein ACFFDK_15840 [Promethearchaeota archaeon]